MAVGIGGGGAGVAAVAHRNRHVRHAGFTPVLHCVVRRASPVASVAEDHAFQSRAVEEAEVLTAYGAGSHRNRPAAGGGVHEQPAGGRARRSVGGIAVVIHDQGVTSGNHRVELVSAGAGIHLGDPDHRAALVDQLNIDRGPVRPVLTGLPNGVGLQVFVDLARNRHAIVRNAHARHPLITVRHYGIGVYSGEVVGAVTVSIPARGQFPTLAGIAVLTIGGQANTLASRRSA